MRLINLLIDKKIAELKKADERIRFVLYKKREGKGFPLPKENRQRFPILKEPSIIEEGKKIKEVV